MGLLWVLYAFTLAVLISESYFTLGMLNTRKKILLRKTWKNYTPEVSVIMPCRGADHKFEDGIKSLLSQDYVGKKEFIFVVDGFGDECVRILKKFKGIKVIKNKHLRGYTGKNSALLTGVMKAKDEIFVFADSDIIPARDWLRSLVEPLQSPEVSVTTGYRWYFPLKKSIVSCIRPAWDGIGFSLMTGKYRFVWGGSFALRRNDFERFDVKKIWKNEISDDAPLTRFLDKNNLHIEFVPRATVANFNSDSFRELVSWSNRQVLMVKMYAKKSWKLGMLVTGSFSFFTVLGILLLVFGNAIGIIFLLPVVLSTLRAWLRYSTLQRLLPEFAHFEKKKTTILMEAAGKFLMFYNTLRAMTIREVEWRGKKYRV
ncbi:MAG: glycosyltransferase family 2 protein [Candidatus Aenigmarchaeota archaeon]|nr:glycosyltransferase family 2 protein [Candidatus Aenigmarchaeota archaeon]